MTAGNTSGLTGHFRCRNLMIYLARCSRSFESRGRHTWRRSLCPHPALRIAVDSVTLLACQCCAAVSAEAWSRALFRLKRIVKESEIPAGGRTMDFRLAVNREPHRLVQQPPAPVALFGNVETLRADIGKFESGKLHAATFESEALKGIGSRKTVGFRPAAPSFQAFSLTRSALLLPFVSNSVDGMGRSAQPLHNSLLRFRGQLLVDIEGYAGPGVAASRISISISSVGIPRSITKSASPAHTAARSFPENLSSWSSHCYFRPSPRRPEEDLPASPPGR